MHPVLARNDWLMDQLWAGYAESAFDFLDPPTGHVLLQSRERKSRTDFPGAIAKFLRGANRFPGPAPFEVLIRSTFGDPVARLSRGTAFTQSEVTVFDEHNVPVGRVLHKGAIMITSCEVLGMDGQLCYSVRRINLDLPMIEYQFLRGATIVARITKYWTGIVKQIGYNINRYRLEISPEIVPDDPGRILLLGAAICVDIVGGTTMTANRSESSQ
jgi:hypothetical protein